MAELVKRPLGRTDMEITVLGLGAWAMGGGGWSYGWGPQDDAQSIRTIHHAIDQGINWIDTAAVYGYGHSEEVVGRAVHELPEQERPFVFTKCGMRWYEDDPMREPQRNLQPASIRQELQDSLRRLGVDRIDLYQFHWPDETGTPVEESWSEMVRLIQEGRVRAGGVSNFTVELLERCEAIRHVDSLQPPFSLINREDAAELFPWCQQHGTGVIVYSPLQSGLLTGHFSAERVANLPDDDWRKRDPQFNEPQLSRNLALVGALEPIAERHGASVAEVAIAWTLAWPGVAGAIVGARSPEQVDGWIGAASLQLTTGDMAEIAAAIERTGAGFGPVRPVQHTGPWRR